MPDMLVHVQHPHAPGHAHAPAVPRSYPYPLTHSQSHPLFKYPSSASPLSPHMLHPSPSCVQLMLRRYSPLLLHLQLNEHQKRKKEKRERRQERRNEKKRLQEQEMAMRLRMEAEQSNSVTATDESLVAQQMRQIEQTQQSQRITPTTTRVQQSLGAALASPQYTASLMMTLEKLSGAQQQEQDTATIAQQSQPPANPSLPPPHRSPTSASPVASHSPSALPVSPSALPASSFRLPVSESSSSSSTASSSLSLIVSTPVASTSTSTSTSTSASTSTSTHLSHPSFRPVMAAHVLTSSPSQRQRELLAQPPRDNKSPSLTTRFLLSKHLPHTLTHPHTHLQDVSADCVELMSCSIEDIPSSCDDSLVVCDDDHDLSSLYADFSRICITHDEYDTRETFHIPHAAEYVSFGPQVV